MAAIPKLARKSSYTGKSKLEQARLTTSAALELASIPQRVHMKVVKERDELNKKLEEALRDNTVWKDKLCHVTEKVLHTVKPSCTQNLSQNTLDLPEQEIIDMIDSLKPERNQSLENRIEELETRITLISGELGKLLKLKMDLEAGLMELAKCQDTEFVQHGLRQLWVQSISTKLFAPNPLEPKEKNEDFEHAPSSATNKENLSSSIWFNLEPVELELPARKMPADTHIKVMHPGLQQLVIQELSLNKGSGADWRMFAQRVGVSESLVAQWIHMRVQQPMRNVLNVWSASPGATVRMLHRHLVSPQMRCLLLAKRISDFYEVD